MQMKNKKNFFHLLVLLVLLLSSAVPAQADFSYPAPAAAATQAFNAILDLLGINRSAMQYGVAVMNAAPQKQTAPQVSLTFTPSDPQLGDKLTATATPLYFMNDTNKIYFTWFLKQKDCDKSDSPSGDEKSRCDLNNDGRVDIEDYKIEAIRIIANADFNWENADYSHSDSNSAYKAVFGGDDQRGKNPSCYIQDVPSGNAYPIDCNSHLFPDAPHENTGDGSYNSEEEKFWHTDPTSTDTAQTGNTDEANVAGLGINTFTWNYTPGDEVGVVVEGSSIEPSLTLDGSYRTMWAAPKGLCSSNTVDANTDYPKTSTTTLSTSIDTPDVGETTTETETTTQTMTNQDGIFATITTTIVDTTTITNSETQAILSQNSSQISSSSATIDISDDIHSLSLKDNGRTIQSISNVSDLNACLYDNLVTPAENSPESQKLDVSLSFSPSSPINDPSSYSSPELSNGDELIVQSSIPNANDATYLQYSWQVFASDEPNPSSWGNPLPKSSLPNATQMDGLGLSSFKFKLNLATQKKYLNIILTAKENTGDNLFREGHASVLVPIISNSNVIDVFDTSLSGTSDPHVSMADEICTSAVENAICPVTKNSIIGVKINSSSLTDFFWTIDGTPFTYQECFFDGCDLNKQTNVAYFPALKEIGDQYTITLTATNQETGEKVNLARTFQVVAPTISISSADESACKPVLLGNYIDMSGRKWPDYSQTDFMGLADNQLTLRAVTTGFTASPADLFWTIDGTTINVDTVAASRFAIDANGVLALPTKQLGENYEVSVGTLYAQSNLVKTALNKYWNVPYDQFYEKNISAHISIQIQEGSLPVASVQAKKILATIYTSTPAYLAFLLRIVLTISLILFTSQLVLSFSPI